MDTRRRSKRLHGGSINATPKTSKFQALSALAEHEDSPTVGPQSNLDAIVSSPVIPRTPATSGRVKPAIGEMHPSLAHQSTTQHPDSGLRLGFVDVDAKGDVPSGIKQQTPSKASALKSTAFDFRFARPAPELGPEAQHMMDSLREEALRIKAKLAAEREEESRQNGEGSVGRIGGRKIAQPKGKVGRFSDVHMAAFKKMDSIAGHASSFRAQPGRVPPPTTTTTRNLKRTQSKAKLAEREDINDGKSTDDGAEQVAKQFPAKRARQNILDDISAARPISQNGDNAPSTTSKLPRAQSSFLAAITTPTKASLARTANTKHTNTHLPVLSRSPSKPSLLGTPRKLQKSATSNGIRVPATEPRGFMRGTGRFDKVKSILRSPSSVLKKPSTIPAPSRTPSKANVNKALPSVPTTPSTSSNLKHMRTTMFHSADKSTPRNAKVSTQARLKSGIPRSAARMNLSQKLLSTAQQDSDEIYYPAVQGHPNLSPEVKYPSLTGSSPRPLPEIPVSRAIKPMKSPSRPPPSVPGTFTFRSDHTISFGASPTGFGSSPGQASLRQVRPSIVPMPGSFPADKENNKDIKMLPSIPHGVATKKRRRIESDDEEEEAQSPNKKHKAVAEGEMLMAPRLVAEQKAFDKQNVSPPKKKAGLSLSRLNMLARPKMRK